MLSPNLLRDGEELDDGAALRLDLEQTGGLLVSVDMASNNKNLAVGNKHRVVKFGKGLFVDEIDR